MKTIIKKLKNKSPSSTSGKIWSWRVMKGRKMIFGGYAATKRDAKSDAKYCIDYGK